MIEPWRACQPDLADDLRPDLEGRTGVAPAGQRQVRPFSRHGGPPCTDRAGLQPYHKAITPVSRSRASFAAALAARRAEKVSAIPAPRHRLKRVADHLGHKKKLDHGGILRSRREI